MINPQLGYDNKTQTLIDRMCRYVERDDYVLDKKTAEEKLLQTYDLFGLSRPKKIVWCKDIFDEKYVKAIWSAGSAGSAWSARSARSAWSAWSAWLAGSAGSARSAWSARSAGSAWLAGSAGSARSAGSAWLAGLAGSAGSARSEMFALDYDFDWYVQEFEYCLNPSNKKPNENDLKYIAYSELLLEALEAGLGLRVEWDDILYLVPIALVKINQQSQFHSETQPSIRWKEGKEFYFLNGINFPKELFKKVTSGTMPFEEILKIEDVDQRVQAFKFSDPWKFVENQKGKVIHEYTKTRIDGKPVRYWLVEIPKGEVFQKDAYFMLYDDAELLDKKVHMQGVPQHKTVQEAMAWKRSNDYITVTPEMWENQVIGLHHT